MLMTKFSLWSRVLVYINVLLLLLVSVISARKVLQGNSGKFLWMTDIHYDPLYDGLVNSTFFCRNNRWQDAIKQHHGHMDKWPANSQRKLLSPRGNAKYGRFGCDAPLQLFTSALKHMRATNDKPDFLVISGDFLAHHLPTVDMALDTLNFVSTQIAKTYPNTMTLPCIGNNDLYPDYYLPFDNSTWFESLYQIWKKWIPEEHQQQSFTKGGYYYMDVYDNLRVLVLNSLYYAPRRWPAVPRLPEDPSDQFQWLAQQLSFASEKKKQVLIVTHIPPSQNAYDSKELWVPQYLEKYLQIIAKNSHVIIGQLYGHLHKDEYRVQLEPGQGIELSSRVNVASGTPVSFGMIGSSIAPVFNNNAAFREFEVSRITGNSSFGSEGYRLAGYKQFYMDIYLSNQMSKEVWSFEYDYNKAYDQKGLDPKSVYQLLQSMVTNPELLTNYIRRQEALYSPNRFKQLCEFANLERQEFLACMENGSNDGV